MAAETAPIKVLARGAGGVEELQAALDETQVTFALLKFQVGSGSFARTKFLCLHNNLETVSVIKRGRTNAKKGAVKAAMGSTHAELVIEEKGDLNLDHILEEMLKVFVADGGDFSVSKLKEDYEALLTQAKLAATKIEGVGSGKRMTAAEMGGDYVSGDKALAAVREPLGPFNWALFLPDETKLAFANAGSMSVNEMRDWLKDDKVYFGILRMGFGSGDFRRTKWIFFHWSGESVGAVKRGRANACKKALHEKLSPTSVDISATDLDECTLEVIIERVKKSVVVDGETKGDDSSDPFTMEAYMAALEEEAKANADFFGDAEGAASTEEYSVEDSLKRIHADDGGVTWILFAAT
uniref:ADF-H domain-containing protein n=1 Tax=Bicosoecida sp. CB-2014 TaxID=1486930 RepID=A0A7S1C4B3_9STRA|mmetsp:Transcript_13057/g.45653  ORF Transcript_13057/g.45653 Transcript_13057/m.45653 type:complete len:353 (+) Transcript_13057:44-1102(+)